MYKLLTKNGQVFAFGLGVLISVIFLGSIFAGLDDFNGMGKEAQYSSGIFNFGIQAAIALVVLGGIAMILFGLYQVATDIKGSMKGILGFAALLVIFGIAYATSSTESGEMWTALFEKFNVTDGNSKFISGAIKTAVSMAGIAAVAFIVSEIRNFFK